MASAAALTSALTQLQTFSDEYVAIALAARDAEVQAALARRQVLDDRLPSLAEAYRLVVQPGPRLARKPNAQTRLRQQIEAAADFLRDFQISVFGQRTLMFQLYELTIRLGVPGPKRFQFQAGHLQIARSPKPLTQAALQQSWNQGKHLSSQSPLRNAWWLFNPLGEVRSNLKGALLFAVQRQVLGLDRVLARLGFAELPATVEAPPGFREQAIAYLSETVDRHKLDFDLDAALEQQSDRWLSQLLRRFRQHLLDPGGLESMLDVASLSLQETLAEERSQVKIQMFGFVNVGNYHRIDVAVNLSSGYLKKYVEVVPRQANVQATLFGFVNIYTIDDITVKPNLHQAVKLDFATAAFEQAYRELGESPAGSL
ncbi:MAG: hypothetical protein HC910_18245 [Spirulinaceae cyanobacterium SM2_1_0]|nr:hypothetical protein [Spirulinaceae cyanobacterium SM2_1_0]